MIIKKEKIVVLLAVSLLLVLFAPNVRSQTGATVPVLDLLLSDEQPEPSGPFTCIPTFVSLTHPVGSTIPLGESFGVRIKYEVKNRPLDYEIGFMGVIENESAGILLTRRDAQGRDYLTVAEENQGEANFSGEVLLSRPHDRALFSYEFQDLRVICTVSFYRDGSRIGTSGPFNQVKVEEQIDWMLERP